MMDSSITVLEQIIIQIMGIFSIVIIFYFLGQFGRRLYYKKWVYGVGFIAYILLFSAAQAFLGIGSTLFISIVLTVVVGHLLYNNKKIYILYYSLYIVCLSVFQIIVSSAFNLICNILNINFYTKGIYFVTLTIVVQIANLAATKFFIMVYKKKEIKNINKVQYFNFLVLPIFSIFYIVTLMMYSQLCLTLEDRLLLLVNVISILILNLYITNIFEAISRNNELKSKVKLYEQQSTMQYKYYSDLESKYTNSRKLIHDMKNHLHTIEGLYEINNNEKAREYSEDLYKMFDDLGQKIYTTNRVLNIIINDKVEMAANFGIILECKIGDVDLDFIKDIDLTTMFSNLLDNAIEAVKEKTDEKNILLKVNNFNDFIVINIANNVDKLPVKDNKEFRTSKEGHSGLGLQNVKMALEKYDGNMRIEYDDKAFKVNIVIPVA